MRLKIFDIYKGVWVKIVLLSQATDEGHATEGAVEEDLTNDDNTRDPIFMPGRHDINSDDSNPPENIMPTNDTWRQWTV